MFVVVWESTFSKTVVPSCMKRDQRRAEKRVFKRRLRQWNFPETGRVEQSLIARKRTARRVIWGIHTNPKR
jgi:hypothetical protein